MENPNLIFIIETRPRETKMQAIRLKCGFKCCQVVDCEGSGRDRARGITLLWNVNINIFISSYFINHIGVSMMNENDNQ